MSEGQETQPSNRLARLMRPIGSLCSSIWNRIRGALKSLCNGIRGMILLYGGYCIVFPIGIWFGYSLAIDNSSCCNAARLSTPLQIMAIVAGLIIAGAISVAGNVSRSREHADDDVAEQPRHTNNDTKSRISIHRLLVLHSAAAILGIGATVVHLVSLEYDMELVSRSMGGLALGTMSLVLVGTLRFLGELDRILSVRT